MTRLTRSGCHTPLAVWQAQSIILVMQVVGVLYLTIPSRWAKKKASTLILHVTFYFIFNVTNSHGHHKLELSMIGFLRFGGQECNARSTHKPSCFLNSQYFPPIVESVAMGEDVRTDT